MDYVNLRISSKSRGLIYEKDFRVYDVFGLFAREHVSRMVQIGLLKDGQRYWVTITPGFGDEPDYSVIVWEGDSPGAVDLPTSNWLSMKLPNVLSDDPLRFFTFDLRTTPPDSKHYCKSFPVSEVEDLGRRVQSGLSKTGLISADEPVQIALYPRFAGNPVFDREIIHTLPEPFNGMEIQVEERSPEESISERPAPVCGCVHEESGSLLIFFRRDVFRNLSEYIMRCASRRQEVGGLLIGEVHRRQNSERQFVLIEDFLPAEQTKADAVSLRFTHDTWQTLLEQKRARFPQAKQVVGWYHTHPPVPVAIGDTKVHTVGFFSADDLAMHRQIFRRPWQVALVMDAESNERVMFRWEGDHVAQSGFHLCD